MRHLRDSPLLTQLGQNARQIVARFKQSEISERAFENIARSGYAPLGQITGQHGIACIKPHLHTEQRRALRMCLHGPAQLGVYDAERTDQAGRIKVTQYC